MACVYYPDVSKQKEKIWIVKSNFAFKSCSRDTMQNRDYFFKSELVIAEGTNSTK